MTESDKAEYSSRIFTCILTTPLRRAVVTHNRVDFEKQHAKFLESGITHYGMIIAKRRKDPEVVNKMLSLLDAVTAEEMKNQLRYI